MIRKLYKDCSGLIPDMLPRVKANSISWKVISPVLCLVLVSFCDLRTSYASPGNDTWIGSNSFGGAGLLQTRSARLRPDGHFEVGYSLVDPYKRYYMTLQGLPWLEGTFRYTEIRNQLYSPFASFSGQQTFKDRGADVTLKLLEETKYQPAMALTLQDGLGTGQYAGEYLTFGKRFFDFDFSGGIAWGYGASGSTIKNPFALFSQTLESRGDGAQTGGDLKFETYFAGENIGLFGGFAYRTPIKGLVFKFEYDPNDYQNEPSNSTLETSSHFNYGINYRPFDWLETSFGVERGYQLSFRLTMISNLHSDGMPKFDPPPQQMKSRVEVENDLKNPTTEDEKWPSWKWPFSKTVTDDPIIGNIQNSKISKLFDSFDLAGLTIIEVELREGASKFVVGGKIPAQAHQTAENIVKAVSEIIPGHSEIITLVAESKPESKASTISYKRSEFEGDQVVVDYLFDELMSKGLQVVDIQFSHKLVELHLSQTEKRVVPDAHIAELVFMSMPIPVEKLIVHLEDTGHVVESFEFNRADAEREALVDELFEIVESEGMEIEAIDVSQGSAEIRLLAVEENKGHQLARTAKRLANAVPMGLDDVTLITARAGTEIARVKVRRSSHGASSGKEWELVETRAGLIESRQEAPNWTEEDRLAISSRVFKELSKVGFSADAFLMDGYRVTIYGSSRKYRFAARNIGRSIRAVANNVPKEIEEISIITVNSSMELNRLTVQRRDFEKAVGGTGSVEEVWASASFENGGNDLFLPDDVVRNTDRYPSMNWLFNPKFRTHIGGPSRFLLYQLFLTAGFDAQPYSGINITGRLRRNIYNNFGRVRFGSSSVLPHVRTDVKEYLQNTKGFSIDRVQGDYFFKPLEDWYGRASVGIFEEMFGGYSMEVLHQPFKSRFAVGIDINRVWKRGFEQRFNFQEYVVNTGHLNLYYDLPWKNISTSAHIGQYLAGDRGVTFMGAREFDGGVVFGLWSTFTNVSAEDFGEGSFDKGFYVRIPFDLFMTKSTTQRGTFGFRPITRDGGARLGMQSRLHGIVNSNNAKRLIHKWSKLLD
jgi:hypothetical protein